MVRRPGDVAERFPHPRARPGSERRVSLDTGHGGRPARRPANEPGDEFLRRRNSWARVGPGADDPIRSGAQATVRAARGVVYQRAPQTVGCGRRAPARQRASPEGAVQLQPRAKPWVTIPRRPSPEGATQSRPRADPRREVFDQRFEDAWNGTAPGSVRRTTDSVRRTEPPLQGSARRGIRNPGLHPGLQLIRPFGAPHRSECTGPADATTARAGARGTHSSPADGHLSEADRPCAGHDR